MAKKTVKARSSKSTKQSAWFYPVRGSYLPCSAEGWLIYLCYLLFVVMEISISADNVMNHSGHWFVEITNYLLFLLLGYFVLTAIAKRHARK